MESFRTDSGTLASHWLGALFLKIGSRAAYRAEDILARGAAPGRFDPIAGLQQTPKQNTSGLVSLFMYMDLQYPYDTGIETA